MTTPAVSAPTDLVYQVDAQRHSLDTVIEAVVPYAELSSANKALYKLPADADGADDADARPLFAVATRATIFHPQGGGQPSDVGTMTVGGTAFDVLSARMDAVAAGRVLHFGRPASADCFLRDFAAGAPVTQAIDAAKRLLYSRLHTAGHVLGAAVRHVVAHDVPGFDELKASHFPGAASCEFRGTIDGAWKEPVQQRVSDCIAQDLRVAIEWWDAAEFRRQGLARLIPAVPAGATPTGVPDDRWRVVRIAGADVYPCGGTHVDATAQCGVTTVTKISRSKGISRVSYALDK